MLFMYLFITCLNTQGNPVQVMVSPMLNNINIHNNISFEYDVLYNVVGFVIRATHIKKNNNHIIIGPLTAWYRCVCVCVLPGNSGACPPAL